MTTSPILRAPLQCDLAVAPWRGGVSPHPFNVQILCLCLLGPANHGRNDVPTLHIVFYQSSIFCLLPLGSQPPSKHVTSLRLSQAQATKRGPWRMRCFVWRSQGAPWSCLSEWKRIHCGKESPGSCHPSWYQEEQRKSHRWIFPKFLSSGIAGCLKLPSFAEGL